MKNYTPTFERKQKSGGQALVLITFALLAMCGLIGLAVDLGWSFFVKKTAQAAADGAAQAAVAEALQRVGGNVTVLCGVSNVDCQDPTPANGNTLASTSNLYNGYQYAIQNGFSVGGHGGRQNVTIQANQVAAPGRLPPTAPGVNDVVYWVTVRTVEQIPQLFSAVLGNSTGMIAARATAGIVRTQVPGSLYSLNQMLDCQNGANCGNDINIGGSDSISAPAGVVMGSECGAITTCAGGVYAGQGHGGGSVVAPSIQIHGNGQADSAPVGGNFPGWTNGYTDPSMFEDPTKGKTQPPVVAPPSVKTCGVLGGAITQSGATPTVLGPYNYYSYHLNGLGQQIPDGNPISISGTIQFDTAGVCPSGPSIAGATQTGSFPAYMFWGGMRINAGSTVTFGTGQYVMVGSLHNGSGGSTSVFDTTGNNTTIQPSGSGASYAGQMFIFTDPTYSGLQPQTAGWPAAGDPSPLLHFGTINDNSGNTQSVALNGYNAAAPTAPTGQLSADYNGFLFWQDRNNSTVNYNADGSFNCAAPYNTAACNKTLTPADSPGLYMHAHSNLSGMQGVIYQPRGAWADMGGHVGISGALQIISGAFNLNSGGSIITLTSPTIPLMRTVNALIE